MKRLISILLCLTLLFLLCMPAQAEEPEAKEVTVQVEYSDAVGTLEDLSLMVEGDKVYVSAKELAERLGYTVHVGDKGVTVINDTEKGRSFSVTSFFFDDAHVSHSVFTRLLDTYEAPFPSIPNGEEDAWIPFRYALLIMGGSVAAIDGTLCIDIPELKIPDVFRLIIQGADEYNFDFTEDLGYEGWASNLMGFTSHAVNLTNGLLKFDGESWAELLKNDARDDSAYDRKYRKQIATLFCTQSESELDAVKKETDKAKDLFLPEGKLGKFYSQYSDMVNSDDVQSLDINKTLSEAAEGQSPYSQYNVGYRFLIKIFGADGALEKFGSSIHKAQEGLEGIGKTYDTMTKLVEIVSYMEEFQNRDDFSIASLEASLNAADDDSFTSRVMSGSMNEYLTIIKSDPLTYSTARWFRNNVDKMIVKGTSISAAMGSITGAELAAWDFISSYLPFYSKGLKATDKFELSMYAGIFSNESAESYRKVRNEVFAKGEEITAERLYDASKCAYAYLKSCLIVREAALASITVTDAYKKGELEGVFQRQNEINAEISELMTVLKDANETNEGLVYGLLPDDNEKYLTDNDDSDLIEAINYAGERSLDVADYYGNITELIEIKELNSDSVATYTNEYLS